MDNYNNNNQDDAIAAAVEAASAVCNSKIQGIDTTLYRENSTLPLRNNSKAYFIGAPSINFRHEGTTNKVPPRLYLKDLSGDEFNQKILVYYSSSGSGKTAELVGSSASRGAHFSFVLSVKDLKKEIYSQFENDLTKDKHYQTRYETEELTSPGNQSNHSSSRKITDGRTYLEIDE